jgi:hypothetical protein
MTARQFEMILEEARSTASVARSIEVLEPSKTETTALAEEVESAANRVRIRLENMTANIVEIGRELQAVKRRLEHGQFLNWVEAACKLSARAAQLKMRAAEWAEGKHEIVSLLEPTAIYALAAPSTPETVRQEVLTRLEEGQRPAPQVVKEMIRVAKERKQGTTENTVKADNPTQRQAAQSGVTTAKVVERQTVRSEHAAAEPGEPRGVRLEADGGENGPPGREGPLPKKAGLQELSPRGRHQIYPDIDPLKDQDPPWINGALKLIPLLAEALPLEYNLSNRQAITHRALEMIPAFTEAVLELQDIPKQQLIEALLKYCAYNDYATRMSRHLAPETTVLGSGNVFEARLASVTDANVTATKGYSVIGLQSKEAADVA